MDKQRTAYCKSCIGRSTAVNELQDFSVNLC